VVLENATSIPNFGADTFYPSEDRYGRFMTGFDDGGILSVTAKSYSIDGEGTTTGAAIVTGGKDWRNLRVSTPSGAVREDGAPMYGRYTSATVVLNGTWWTGTYGLALAPLGSKDVSKTVEMGPFVGFRSSIDDGRHWAEPLTPSGHALNVSHSLFGEKPGAAIKYGSPHVVDHGPENRHSPDRAVYMVASGCLAPGANPNCTWISGDGVFLAKALGVDATKPNSLNGVDNWRFWDGKEWGTEVGAAEPVLTWRGRVGAVTASWHPGLSKYLMVVTGPTVHPYDISGPYDTFVVESEALTGPWGMVTYMPRFGMQAYFVSLPSAWLGAPIFQSQGPGQGEEAGEVPRDGTAKGVSFDAVLTFSANFNCHIEGCAANILNAGYGANLLPVRFTPAA